MKLKKLLLDCSGTCGVIIVDHDRLINYSGRVSDIPKDLLSRRCKYWDASQFFNGTIMIYLKKSE